MTLTNTTDAINLDPKKSLVSVIPYFKEYLNYNCAFEKGLEYTTSDRKYYLILKSQFESVLGESRLKEISDSYCRSAMNTLRTLDNKYILPQSGKSTYDAR